MLLMDVNISMTDLYYSVGKEIFLNKFQAAHVAATTGQSLRFVMYEQAFDRVDWTKEPELSWDQLLDIRAQQIAAKNKPIVLNFSGGTDSYTILKVFERNNIHIDALYFRYRTEQRDQLFYNKVFEFLKNGIYDPHCEIIYASDNSSMLPKIYHNKEWIWNTADRYNFSMWGGTGASDELLRQKFGSDIVSVIGFDKPRLIFNRQGIYCFQDDINYVRPMNSPGMDCFFINPELPELHVKQSWMLKKYLVAKYQLTENSNFDAVQKQWDPTVFSWEEYSKASGRYGDLANSHLQHVRNIGNKLEVPAAGDFNNSKFVGTGQEIFESIKGTKLFENYILAFLDVKNDAAGKYLGMSNDNLYNVKMLKSKLYRMPWQG